MKYPAILALTLLACAGNVFALPLISLSAVDGASYTQNIAVSPGQNVVLAYRIQNVADLAWWSITMDKRFESDPDCDFVDVSDALPDWSFADSGNNGPPDYHYIANSFCWSGDEFTGSGDMGYIEILPLRTMSITAIEFELVDGTAQLIEYDLGEVVVNIQVASTSQANAGEDTHGYESRGLLKYVVRLDGTASIGASTYTWEQLAGVGVTLRGGDTAAPDFDAPQWDGSTELTKTQARLRFRLTINHGTPDQDDDEVEVHVRIPGDANGDEVVNAFDIALLRRLDPNADFNGDGTVNAFDLAILRQNSGRRRTVN